MLGTLQSVTVKQLLRAVGALKEVERLLMSQVALKQLRIRTETTFGML